MLTKWFRNRKQNKVAEALRQAAYERAQLLDVMRKSVDRTVFHKNLVNKEDIRNRPVVPTSVSYDYYQTLERLGASPKLLRNVKPIVKDWPDDENPGNFIFQS